MHIYSLIFPGTAIGSVVTAALVCLTMAVTVSVLMRQAAQSAGRQRRGWQATIVLVAGVGVWTTHFVAILGYRPDAALSYGVATTLLSGIVGLLLVGVPLAVAAVSLDRRARGAMGAVAGLGVGVMHYTGMAALEGCIVSNDLAFVLVAVVSGSLLVALSMVPGLRDHVAARAAGLVGGVCALHFTAVAGVGIEQTSAVVEQALDSTLLTILVAVASLALSVFAIFAITATRRINDERRNAAEAESHQNRLLSLAMRNMSNGLIMLDEDDVVVAFNEQAVLLMNLAAGDIREGMPFSNVIDRFGAVEGWSAAEVARVKKMHRDNVARSSTTHVEADLSSGKHLRISCRPMADGGAVLTYDDVTERRHAEAAVTRMAYHDPLTGLPNRRSFRERMCELLRSGDVSSVVLLDLDRFKAVNDSLGHHVGDMLLSEVAERLGHFCMGCQLFRLGGDELAILPGRSDAAQVRVMAQDVIDAMSEPFKVQDHSIKIGCSVGVACVEGDEGADVLLQKADLALYRAKALGRNRLEFYEPGMMEQAQMRRDLEVDLAGAVKNGELVLHYQPLFDLPERRLAGFEALVRWEHPVRGRVSPAEFIPLSEENGMILEIGEWVIDEACREAAKWPRHIHIALNVSAVQMRRIGIVDQIAAALARHGIAASRLEIELTETAMVEDGKAIAESVSALRRLGVRIAMDDFGTGYSSLAHLREFELDRIKIDRSFVEVEHDDHEARAVVRAVTGMAREMSITTVGEGVETAEQLHRLTELGCDTAQGFYLGRPMDASAAYELIMIDAFAEDAAAEWIEQALAGRAAS